MSRQRVSGAWGLNNGFVCDCFDFAENSIEYVLNCIVVGVWFGDEWDGEQFEFG